MYYLPFTATMAAMPEMPSSRGAMVAAEHGEEKEKEVNKLAPSNEAAHVSSRGEMRSTSHESHRLSLRPRALRVDHVKQKAAAEVRGEGEGGAAYSTSHERGKRTINASQRRLCNRERGVAVALERPSTSRRSVSTSRNAVVSIVGKIRNHIVYSRHEGFEEGTEDEEEKEHAEKAPGSATELPYSPPPRSHQREHHQQQRLRDDEDEEASPSIRCHSSRSRHTRTRTARVTSSSSPITTSTSTSLDGSPGRLRRIAALQRALAEAEALARRLEKHIEKEEKEKNGGEEDNKKGDNDQISSPPPRGENDDEEDDEDGMSCAGKTNMKKKNLALQVSDALYRREHMYLLTSGVAAFKRKKLESEKLLQEVLMGKTRGVNNGAGAGGGGGSSGYYNYTQTARGNRGWLRSSYGGGGEEEVKVGVGLNSMQAHFAGDDPHNTGNALLAAHRHKIGLDKSSKCALCEMTFPTKVMAATVTYKAIFELQKKWKTRWEAQALQLQVEASRNGGGGGGKRKELGEESRASSPRYSTPSPSSPTEKRRAMSTNSPSSGHMRGGRSRSPPPSPLSAVSSPSPRPMTSGIFVGWAEQRRTSRSQSTTVSQHAKARTLSSSPSVLYDKCLLCRFCAQHVGVYLGESSLGETHDAEEESHLAGSHITERESGPTFSGRVPMSGDSFSFNSTMVGAKPGEEACEAFSRVLETTYVNLTADDDHGGGERATHVYQEGHPLLEDRVGAAEREVGISDLISGAYGSSDDKGAESSNNATTTMTTTKDNIVVVPCKQYQQQQYPKRPWSAQVRGAAANGDGEGNGNGRSVSPSGHRANVGPPRPATASLQRHNQPKDARIPQSHGMRAYRGEDGDAGGRATPSNSPARDGHPLVDEGKEQSKPKVFACGGLQQITRHTFTSLARLREVEARLGKKVLHDPFDGETNTKIHLLAAAELERRRRDERDEDGGIIIITKVNEEENQTNHDDVDCDDERLKETMPFHEWVRLKLRALPPLDLELFPNSAASPLDDAVDANVNSPYPLEHVQQQRGESSLLMGQTISAASSVDFNATTNTINTIDNNTYTSTLSSPTSSSTRSGRRVWERGENKINKSSSSSLPTTKIKGVTTVEEDQKEKDNNTKCNENANYEEEGEEGETRRASIAITAAHDTTKAPHGDEEDAAEGTALKKSKDNTRIKKKKQHEQQKQDIVALAVKRLTANKRSPPPSMSTVAAGPGLGPRRRAHSSKPSLPIPTIVVSRASDASDCPPPTTGEKSEERTRSATKKKTRVSSSSKSAAATDDSGLTLRNQQQHQQKTKKRKGSPGGTVGPLDTPNGKSCNNANADGVALEALADAFGALGVDSDVVGAGLDVIGVTNDVTSPTSASTPKSQTPAFTASPTNKSPSVSPTADYFEYFAGEGEREGEYENGMERNASSPSRRTRRRNHNKGEGATEIQPAALFGEAREVEGADNTTNTASSSYDTRTVTHDFYDNSDGEARVRRNSSEQENHNNKSERVYDEEGNDRHVSTEENACKNSSGDSKQNNDEELASGDVREEGEAGDAGHTPPSVGNGLTSVYVEGIEEASGIFLTPPTFDHHVLTLPHHNTGNYKTCDHSMNTSTILLAEEEEEHEKQEEKKAINRNLPFTDTNADDPEGEVKGELAPPTTRRAEDVKTEVTKKGKKKLTSHTAAGDDEKTEDKKSAKKKQRTINAHEHKAGSTTAAAAPSSHQQPQTLANTKVVEHSEAQRQRKTDSVKNGVRDPKSTAATSRREEKEYFFHNPQEAPTSRRIVFKQPTPSFTSDPSRRDAAKTTNKRTEEKGDTRSFSVEKEKKGVSSVALNKESSRIITSGQRGNTASFTEPTSSKSHPRQGNGSTKARLSSEHTDELWPREPLVPPIDNNEGVTIHVGEVPCGAKRV